MVTGSRGSAATAATVAATRHLGRRWAGQSGGGSSSRAAGWVGGTGR